MDIRYSAYYVVNIQSTEYCEVICITELIKTEPVRCIFHHLCFYAVLTVTVTCRFTLLITLTVISNVKYNAHLIEVNGSRCSPMRLNIKMLYSQCSVLASVITG